MQAAVDKAAGLNTKGFVTGYRGSPLGAVDQQFAGAAKFLETSGVVFQEGLKEDLAATAVWGTQQGNLRGEGACDDVFALWYGKGPGVDRSGDVFRHGNLAGTARYGGVLALLGDDHTCESSTTCHQSEYALVDAMMPILNPANIEEILSFGMHGWALSRFAGLWAWATQAPAANQQGCRPRPQARPKGGPSRLVHQPDAHVGAFCRQSEGLRDGSSRSAYRLD